MITAKEAAKLSDRNSKVVYSIKDIYSQIDLAARCGRRFASISMRLNQNEISIIKDYLAKMGYAVTSIPKQPNFFNKDNVKFEISWQHVHRVNF